MLRKILLLGALLGASLNVSAETISDDFETGDYNGSTGAPLFVGPWIELGDDNSSQSGLITIGTEGRPTDTDKRLTLTNYGRSADQHASISRVVDLTDMTDISVSFFYIAQATSSDRFEVTATSESSNSSLVIWRGTGGSWGTVTGSLLDNFAGQIVTIDIRILSPFFDGSPSHLVFIDNFTISGTYNGTAPGTVLNENFSGNYSDFTWSEYMTYPDDYHYSYGRNDHTNGTSPDYVTLHSESSINISSQFGFQSQAIDVTGAQILTLDWLVREAKATSGSIRVCDPTDIYTPCKFIFPNHDATNDLTEFSGSEDLMSWVNTYDVDIIQIRLVASYGIPNEATVDQQIQFHNIKLTSDIVASSVADDNGDSDDPNEDPIEPDPEPTCEETNTCNDGRG